MKNLIKLFIIILLTSCSSTKIIELSAKVSAEGIEVSQKGLDVYATLSKQADIDKYQQDKIKVLTHPSPAIMALPNTAVQDFSKQLEPRIKAYQSLLSTYQAFNLLTDSKYGDKTKEAVNTLANSYNSIEKLPDLPTSVSSKLPEISKILTQAIQAKKIKIHNEVLYRLTELYLLLWNNDLKTWNEYLDAIYNTYALGLNSVDSKKFDVKKISQDLKEPYSDDAVIILIYRLNNRNEIIRQRDVIKKQLSDFGKALSAINKAHSEIAKEKTDISDVVSSLNTIENLLKLK
ncbi:MAG: hypothetical protein HXX14_14665 [Bacteroidetes bacterium]|nr:hypothetical protein [Bacteroidota bacterium]